MTLLEILHKPLSMGFDITFSTSEGFFKIRVTKHLENNKMAVIDKALGFTSRYDEKIIAFEIEDSMNEIFKLIHSS